MDFLRLKAAAVASASDIATAANVDAEAVGDEDTELLRPRLAADENVGAGLGIALSSRLSSASSTWAKGLRQRWEDR